jgi:hypothetical protein
MSRTYFYPELMDDDNYNFYMRNVAYSLFIESNMTISHLLTVEEQTVETSY